MAKKERFNWQNRPAEIKKVAALPNDDQLAGKIKKIAERLGISEEAVKSKWTYERGKKSASKKAPNKKATGDVDAMILDFDEDYVLQNGGKLEPKEIKSFEKGLEANVPKLLPGKGAVTVPRRFERVAREYMDKHHPTMVYALQTITGNKDARRLVRKA